MRKKFILSCCIFTLLFCHIVETNSVYADQSEQKILSEEIPAGAKDEARRWVDEYVTMIYDYDTHREVFDDSSDIYMGEAFRVYNLTEKEIFVSDEMYFPIVQRGSIKLLLTVICEDGDYSSSCSIGFADELNTLTEENVCIVRYNEVIYAIGKKEIVFMGDSYDVNQSENVKEILAQMPNMASIQMKEIQLLNNLQPVEIPYDRSEEIALLNEDIPEGFVQYSDTYKVLDMSHCLLDQRDHNGNIRGMCWASSAATIIRYRTGDRSVTAPMICLMLGIGQDEGGSPNLVWDALNISIYDVAGTQYQVRMRAAMDQTEIQHNLNNRFPFSLGLTHEVVGGHRVTAVGFRIDEGGEMALMCWDSSTESVIATHFIGIGTKITIDEVTFRWSNSVLVPYYEN